ncbi:MAG: hypothetical protein ABSE17_00325 [Candidatus Levyibacteriota bacterium]|jgi:hypothetical protein
MNDNKFTTGLLLGLILGGGAVFLLGTRTGKNLLKIVSERGMDGLVELLEEYNFDDLEEEEMADEGEIPAEEVQPESKEETSSHQSEKKDSSPKKHFFKRIRK